MRCAAPVLAAAAALALAAPAGAAPGMTGAWSFDDPAASPVAGAASAAAGRYGRALAFDGIDDRVAIPHSTAGGAFTLEAWVRPAALGGGPWRAAAVIEPAGGPAAGLYADRGTGRPGAIAGDLGVAARRPLALNAWSHLAMTSDGATLRLYADARLLAAAPVAGLGGGPGTLSLGGTGAWGEAYAGLIDELRVYDRALAPAEIRADRDTPLSSPALRTRPGRIAPRRRHTRLAAQAYGERPAATRRPAAAHRVRWLR